MLPVWGRLRAMIGALFRGFDLDLVDACSVFWVDLPGHVPLDCVGVRHSVALISYLWLSKTVYLTCCCWSKFNACGLDCSLIASFSFSFSSCSSCILNKLVNGDGVVNGLWWKPACNPSKGFVCINWANAAGLSRICGGNDWIIFEMLPANPYCAVIIEFKN